MTKTHPAPNGGIIIELYLCCVFCWIFSMTAQSPQREQRSLFDLGVSYVFAAVGSRQDFLVRSLRRDIGFPCRFSTFLRRHPVRVHVSEITAESVVQLGNQQSVGVGHRRTFFFDFVGQFLVSALISFAVPMAAKQFFIIMVNELLFTVALSVSLRNSKASGCFYVLSKNTRRPIGRSHPRCPPDFSSGFLQKSIFSIYFSKIHSRCGPQVHIYYFVFVSFCKNTYS